MYQYSNPLLGSHMAAWSNSYIDLSYLTYYQLLDDRHSLEPYARIVLIEFRLIDRVVQWVTLNNIFHKKKDDNTLSIYYIFGQHTTKQIHFFLTSVIVQFIRGSVRKFAESGLRTQNKNTVFKSFNYHVYIFIIKSLIIV